MLFESADVAFRSVVAVTALGQFIVGSQTLANRRLFERGGILDWQIIRRFYGTSRIASKITSAVPFDAAVVVGLAVLKCASAVGAVIMVLGGASPMVPLTGLVVSNAGLAIRAPIGGTGSVDMGNVVCLAALFAALVRSPGATTACLVFIALQASLAYAAAGLGKIPHLSWRDGSALRDLSATDCWGHARAAAWMRRAEWFPKATGRLIMTLEVCFPLLLLVPSELAAIGLLSGVVFHVLIATLMGLNTFAWMFPATYPAIMFTNILIHSSLLGR